MTSTFRTALEAWAAWHRHWSRRHVFGTSQELIAWLQAEEPCEHEWEYLERKPGETYTGYCERCTRCGEIVQIPQ